MYVESIHDYRLDSLALTTFPHWWMPFGVGVDPNIISSRLWRRGLAPPLSGSLMLLPPTYHPQIQHLQPTEKFPILNQVARRAQVIWMQ